MTLIFGEDSVEFKLKTKLGNYNDLADELKTMAEMGNFETIAKLLEEKSGGLEKMKEKWQNSYLHAIGAMGLKSS